MQLAEATPQFLPRMNVWECRKLHLIVLVRFLTFPVAFYIFVDPPRVITWREQQARFLQFGVVHGIHFDHSLNLKIPSTMGLETQIASRRSLGCV